MPRNAAAVLSTKDPLEGFRHLAMVSGTQHPIPLSGTKFSVRILAGMALVAAERAFRNAEAHSIEATMTFPVPVHAALVGMSARIGERTVLATARRKQAARETYEEAIDGGKTAVLHEEALRGVHVISVGHVPPGEQVSVLATWAMPLSVAGAFTKLSIPTTVGDVYGRSPLPDSDDLTHARVKLEADVEVFCDAGSARLVGGNLVDGKARVRLDAPIEIIVTRAPTMGLCGVAADGRAVELTVEPAAGGDGSLDAVLLLDNSGSMVEPAAGRYGERGSSPSKHDVALRGLKDAAAALHPSDRADVWEFNSEPQYVGGGTGAAAIGRAVSMLNQPTGGTELGEAIDAVLRARESADVLLVTDGKSHALDVHAAARRGARFTVVLVGEDSLAANVGHLAALTGGQVFVSSGLDLPEVLRLALASMRAPRVHQALLPGGAVPEAAEALSGGMRISARWTAAGQDAVSRSDEAGRAVAAYAAWLALPLMSEDDAAVLAEAEGVVCHLTSLVLVDHAGEAQEGIPAQRKVPLMSPATSASFMQMARPPLDAFAFSPTGGALRPRALRRLSPSTLSLHFRMAVSSNAPTPGVPARRRSLRKLASIKASDVGTDLSPFRGQVDWSGDLQALRQGNLHGNVPVDVLPHLLRAAGLAEVRDLAASLGARVEAVVVALLARAEASSHRGAARLARTVLGKASPAELNAAAKAMGLAVIVASSAEL